MSGDEYIKFEITEDDIASEFNIKKGRRPTKNQQIYGIWADDDSDNDGNAARKGSYKNKKSYAGPVNFVAGGVHQPGSKSEETTEKDEEEGASDAEAAIQISDSSDEDIAVRSSLFPKKKNVESPVFNEGEMAGFRKFGQSEQNTVLIQKGVGSWEKHTKGIGAKLLLQMGFQPGKGLGKDLQGIQAPIEAHLRKGRGAIGAYGPEKKTKVGKLDKTTDKDDVNKTEKDKSDKTSLWRKEGSDSNKKIRYVYKSVDEVLAESKKPGKKKIEMSELSKVKVIDMTGPEQRILSGYHAISGVQKPAEEWEQRKDKKFSNFSMPELQHNLNLLVDLSEQAIIENDRKLKYSEDRLAVVENQALSVAEAIKQDEIIINELQKMIDTVEYVTQSSNDKSLSLEKAEEIFSSLKEKHLNEFYAYEMPLLAVNIVRPLLKESLESWKPLEEPTKPIPEFVKWRDILQFDDSRQASLNPYHKLVWDAWVPCVRIATSSWQCRQWSPMVDFIMNWIPLISKWILENILQDMILRRIQFDVDEWNPLVDCIPIHTWIYPWITFLGKNFETSVYPTIRHKLSKALCSWHPSDSSARLMLQPWTNVFDQGEMDAFIVANIVPKLQIALQEFVINPHQQHLDNWNWVMDWNELIPAHTMAVILDKCFFPKWIQTLKVWLNMNPDFDQVSKWFTGWKSIIPETIRIQPLVMDHIRTALDLMSQSAGGPSSSNVINERVQRAPVIEDSLESIRLQSKISFKEMIQKRCEESGILWMPVPNRFVESKQVYRCGKLMTYIDRNVLFVSQGGGSFVPMSYQEMLENAL